MATKGGPAILYETRNALEDKWPMLARMGSWIFLFIFALMWLLVNFIDARPSLLHWRIRARIPHDPHSWWVALGASMGTALFVAAIGVLAAALLVRARTFLVCNDRIRVCTGRLTWDLPFDNVTAVERVSFAPWPRLGSFWQDLKAQVQTMLLTPRYCQVGLGQTLEPQATLVKVAVRGRRWWRGYFFDVDNPDGFFGALTQALASYRAVAGQRSGNPVSS